MRCLTGRRPVRSSVNDDEYRAVGVDIRHRRDRNLKVDQALNDANSLVWILRSARSGAAHNQNALASVRVSNPEYREPVTEIFRGSVGNIIHRAWQLGRIQCPAYKRG